MIKNIILLESIVLSRNDTGNLCPLNNERERNTSKEFFTSDINVTVFGADDQSKGGNVVHSGHEMDSKKSCFTYLTIFLTFRISMPKCDEFIFQLLI
jgi:hypothetical protein